MSPRKPDAPARRRPADLLPGGSLSTFGIANTVIARGRGSHVWDVDGAEYVDFVLGSGPLVVGHAHPAVVEAVQRQAELGSTFYAPNEPILALAERMIERIPCAELVQFAGSGGEATFYAMRLARAATGRDAVLKFEGGYHGANDYGMMSVFPSGPPSYPRSEPGSGGIPGVLEGEVLVAPFNDLERTAAIVAEHGSRLAAIILEPFQRVIEPAPGFLAGLRALADAHGIVLVFDEIVTGFRFGPGGAQEHYGVIPDLAAYGKIIGGGFPLAAVAGRRDLLELADPARRGRPDFVQFSGTLNGNPVAAAAGLATLDVLDEPGSYERLFAAGERIRAGLRAVLAEAGRPAQVLGVGPIFQVFLTDEPVTDYRSARRADAARMKRVAGLLRERGFLLTGEKAYLSLVHADTELDRAVEAFAEALGELGE